jgi:hypothetical protein
VVATGGSVMLRNQLAASGVGGREGAARGEERKRGRTVRRGGGVRGLDFGTYD